MIAIQCTFYYTYSCDVIFNNHSPSQDPEKPGMKPTMQTYDVDLNA